MCSEKQRATLANLAALHHDSVRMVVHKFEEGSWVKGVAETLDDRMRQTDGDVEPCSTNFGFGLHICP